MNRFGSWHASVDAGERSGCQGKEKILRHLSFNWRGPAVLLACLWVAACGDGSSASSDNAASDATAQGSGTSQSTMGGNDTPTGLPAAPWAAASSPKPASGALLPPVIHTVDD
ncbi:hypothetical protein [Paraburkholderia rhizosphaerae]|uniref:Uncharacterized protein n=1 Tax=Paraburkholderia rhizosphaerae TaxID=480658 RepID=A0A4R8LZN4_9BURK|nr:hypothetical protein [Paraburkholderia rhizosphaerae]TDY52210.1 hypothetical protein BX592_10594 [Paraburkholderia rhizosphaerae]